LEVPVVVFSVEVDDEPGTPAEVVVDGLDVAALAFPVKAFLLPLPFAGGTVPVPVPAPGFTADLEESTLFLGISIEAFPLPSDDPAGV
jgi:hypothetical protein